MKTVLATTALSLLMLHGPANAGNWIDGTVNQIEGQGDLGVNEFIVGPPGAGSNGERFRVVPATGGIPRGAQRIAPPPVGSVVSVFSWHVSDVAMHIIIHESPSE
jgi:hypothetical protein